MTTRNGALTMRALLVLILLLAHAASFLQQCGQWRTPRLSLAMLEQLQDLGAAARPQMQLPTASQRLWGSSGVGMGMGMGAVTRMRQRRRTTRLDMQPDPEYDDGDYDDDRPTLIADDDDDDDDDDLDLLSGDDDQDDDDSGLDFDDMTMSGIEGLENIDLDLLIDLDEEGNPINGSVATTMSWADRRQLKLAKLKERFAKSWEETYEDDPMRSESATVDVDVSAYIPFGKTFVLCGDISDATMLLNRQEAWMHHLQWVRRNSLTSIDQKKVHIDWEYTRLSKDSMGPVGQVLGIRGNSSEDVRELLQSEPLFANGGVSSWTMYEYTPVEHDNITCVMTDPFLFIGHHTSVKPIGGAELDAWLDYHTQTAGQVVSVGELISVDDACGKNGDARGTIIVFNAKTVKGAERYISNDPLVKSGAISMDPKNLSPINIQDTDGLHHFMARSFTEAREMNKVSDRHGTALRTLLQLLQSLYTHISFCLPHVFFRTPDTLHGSLRHFGVAGHAPQKIATPRGREREGAGAAQD